MAARIRTPVTHLSAGEVTLDRATSHYLVHVLRLPEGGRFEVFDPSSGHEADAVVRSITGERVTAVLSTIRDAGRTASRSIVWIQGLPKGDKPDAIVRDATELGAGRVILAPSARSVATFDSARIAGKRDRWNRIAAQAARQCGRGDPPPVHAETSWIDAIASIPSHTARFCLFEGATTPLGPSLLQLAPTHPLAFAVGPEGGLTDAEVASALEGGWQICSLGPLILRTETVVTAVLGAIAIATVATP